MQAVHYIRLAYAIRPAGAENEKYKSPRVRGKSWASLFCVKFRDDNAVRHELCFE